MRLPALLESYALSVCSADFNDWIRKNVSIDFPASYLFSAEWEMPEFDLGHTFHYAEMAYLISRGPSWSSGGITTVWLLTRGSDPSTPRSAAFTTRWAWASARTSSSSIVGKRFTGSARSSFSKDT